jgi:hypothetical protein
VSGVAVVWAESSDEDAAEGEEQAGGEVDETFAARRLRRWLRGMFGGQLRPEEEDKPPPQESSS